ncbi:hypothetical protein HMPREF1989_00106 [Porphyromonas gingivalis F0566]|nr:hypothetical protein HMPREF1989_00106 [Porphyromonas gingivalis F0566]
MTQKNQNPKNGMDIIKIFVIIDSVYMSKKIFEKKEMDIPPL